MRLSKDCLSHSSPGHQLKKSPKESHKNESLRDSFFLLKILWANCGTSPNKNNDWMLGFKNINKKMSYHKANSPGG